MARKKKSNGQLWVMLALIVIIIAVIVLPVSYTHLTLPTTSRV